MKNAFYFKLKALFFLEIFTFLSLAFDYVEKRLVKKAMVNFKIYDITDWTINNYNIHILRSKGNQLMMFGQLIEYNLINVFLKNHTQNVMEKLVPDPFVENHKFSIFLDQQSKML